MVKVVREIIKVIIVAIDIIKKVMQAVLVVIEVSKVVKVIRVIIEVANLNSDKEVIQVNFVSKYRCLNRKIKFTY